MFDAHFLGDRPLGGVASRNSSVGAPLAALDGDSLSRRFHVWRDEAGLRLVCTVFRAGDDEMLDCLEDNHTAIVIGASLDAFGLRRMNVVVGPDELTVQTLRDLREQCPEIREWHVHLLAATRESARALAARLRAAACA